MSITLLQYLQLPNPKIESYCKPGTVTINRSWSAVTGLKEWKEFNMNILLSCYGGILNAPVPDAWLPSVSPGLTGLEEEVWDEDSLRLLLARSLNPEVNAALAVAYRLLYEDREDPVEIRGGGVATRHQDTDFRFYPDWAAIRPSVRQHDHNCYINLCPGETKVAAKWQSWAEKLPHYNNVWRQGQTYAGVVCKTRYGWLLTDEELVVFRIQTQKIEAGLAKERSRRATPHSSASHNRRISETSQLSSISSGMSDLSISDYIESNSNVEYGPIQYRSIPWSRNNGKMTIKLALFWILMLASVPETSKSVESGYPPLDSCIETSKGYIHTSTGLRSRTKPKNAVILDKMEFLTLVTAR
jgi:hypothetical protein